MKTVNATELNRQLAAGEVCLIDVREPVEYQVAHIEGAYLIPLAEISAELLPSTEKPLVIHCRSGKRSLDACHKLLQENPQLQVASLEGGILAWGQAGFRIHTSEIRQEL